jgi:hypothetical protein
MNRFVADLLAVLAVSMLGCGLDATAIDDGTPATEETDTDADEEQCVSGHQKICRCPQGGDGYAVCEDGIYGSCMGCSAEPSAGAGGASEEGGSGGAGTGGVGGEATPTAGTGAVGGSGAVGGAGDGGGGAGGTPATSGSCPPPYLCQTSPYMPGIFFCSEPAGLLGPIPAFCTTNADCDAAGLPGTPCADTGMGVAVCLAPFRRQPGVCSLTSSPSPASRPPFET